MRVMSMPSFTRIMLFSGAMLWSMTRFCATSGRACRTTSKLNSSPKSLVFSHVGVDRPDEIGDADALRLGKGVRSR